MFKTSGNSDLDAAGRCYRKLKTHGNPQMLSLLAKVIDPKVTYPKVIGSEGQSGISPQKSSDFFSAKRLNRGCSVVIFMRFINKCEYHTGCPPQPNGQSA